MDKYALILALLQTLQEQFGENLEEFQSELEQFQIYLYEKQTQVKRRRKPTKRVREKVLKLNPIDDLLFAKIAENKKAMEEIVCAITGRTVRVQEVRAQYSLVNLHGRSVVLDVFIDAVEVTDAGEKPVYINIEVQKKDDDDHIRRIGYNTSIVDTSRLEKGTQFAELRETWGILISAYDPLCKKGRRRKKSRRKILHVFDDPEYARFGKKFWLVNSSVPDDYVEPENKDLQKLMKIFTEDDAYDFDLYPEFSRAKHNFKVLKIGVDEMYDIVQELIDGPIRRAKKQTEAARRETAAAREETAAAREEIEALRALVRKLGGSEEEIRAAGVAS